MTASRPAPVLRLTRPLKLKLVPVLLLLLREQQQGCAAEEGLTLVPSGNLTGFKGVKAEGRRFTSHYKLDGLCLNLGRFQAHAD